MKHLFRMAGLALVVALVLMAQPAPVAAATCTSKTGSGNWSSNGTWDNTGGCGKTPGAGDNVIITDATPVTLDVSPTIVNLTIQSGGTLLGGSQTLTLTGNWSNSGAFTAGTSTVTFNGGATQTIGGTVATAFNNLTVNSNSVVVLPATNIPTASGTVTNNGVLQQTQTIDNSNFHFANIKDASSADKYRGVVITTTASLGSTTVQVYGNQNTSGSAGTPVNRWYQIDPTSAGTADLTFHFLCSELQTGQTPANLKVWRLVAGVWEQVGNTINSGATCTTNGSITVTGVSLSADAQKYVLKIYDPLAVEMERFEAAVQGDQIVVEWETVNERENLGFHLDRATSTEGPWTRINPTLIPSVSPGSPWGFAYEYADVTAVWGHIYFYRLTSVDLVGLEEMAGATEVQFGEWQRIWLPLV